MSKIAIFDRYGVLVNTSERKHESIFDDRGIAYEADYFIIVGRKYDLSDPKAVLSIPIPIFKAGGAAVLDLSYIMKIRCGIVENAELIPAFVSKTLELMLASKMLWCARDYLQVIRNYYRCDLIDAGEIFEAGFRSNYPYLFSESDDPVEGEHLSTKYYFENRNRRYVEYKTVKAICPDLVPPTVRGYLQIRTRRTKRFLNIQNICEEQGIVFDFSKNRHFCKKFNTYVDITKSYNKDKRYPVISSCLCSLFSQGICSDPVTANNLPCIFIAKAKDTPTNLTNEKLKPSLIQRIFRLFN